MNVQEVRLNAVLGIRPYVGVEGGLGVSQEFDPSKSTPASMVLVQMVQHCFDNGASMFFVDNLVLFKAQPTKSLRKVPVRP